LNRENFVTQEDFQLLLKEDFPTCINAVHSFIYIVIKYHMVKVARPLHCRHTTSKHGL